MLALRLPPKMEARLEALAQRTGRSKSFYAREVILEHLEDLEDLYMAEEARAEHCAAGGATASMERVMERYGERRTPFVYITSLIGGVPLTGTACRGQVGAYAPFSAAAVSLKFSFMPMCVARKPRAS